MVRRQRGAAQFLHLCVRRTSRESSGGIGLFFQFVGVFTLGGAVTEIGGDFFHRLCSSFLFLLGWRLLCIGGRSAFPTSLGIGLGLCGWRCDLLGAGNVNPRQGGLLVGSFVLLVIVFDIGVRNLIGILLQRAAELLGKNLHARKVHLFFERGPFVEAAFFRCAGHLQDLRIPGCELTTKGRRHSRLQRFDQLFKLRAGDRGFAGVALLGSVGAETLQRNHRIVGSNVCFGGLIGRGRGALLRLRSGGGRCSRLRRLSVSQAGKQHTHEALGTHESIASREKLR